MKRSFTLLLLLLLLLVLTATGCGSAPPPPPAASPPPPAASPPPPPTRLQLTLQAALDLNPDPRGRPSPVVVRLYQLQTTDAFTRADFFALYEREAAVLGADLVTREELLLRPGETRPLDRTLAADTRYLGVLVAYRDLDRAVWRTALATPPQRTTVVTLAVQRSAVQVLPR